MTEQRRPFAHDAVLSMEADGDVGAPGATITVALCGHWDHEPPCPLAPHHTAAARVDGEVRLRTLFVVEPARESEVRARIRAALQAGAIVSGDGRRARWRLCSDGASSVREEEADHARHLG
ncbi:MAG TPA: hypothetical protein VNA28_02135 [Solirubrobacteraceae bacterium]|nr:hypothetical protein [Solirubrobacteraceae bacterium]